MPWAAAIPAVIGAVGSIIGNKQQGDAAARAARMAGPHGVSGDFGSSTVDSNGNMHFSLNPQDQQFGDLARKLGYGQLGRFQANPMDALDPSQASAGYNYGNVLDHLGSQYGGMADTLFGQLSNMGTPEQIAQNRYDLLSRQAAPGESMARNSLQAKLQAQGRLGTSGGGVDTKALYDSQGGMDLSRQLAGQDLGMSWQKQLSDMFSQFSGASASTGAARYGLANDLIHQGQANNTNVMTNASDMQGLYQQLFQPLFAAQKMNDGNPEGAKIGAAQAGATGDMFSGMLDQLTHGGASSPVGSAVTKIAGMF